LIIAATLGTPLSTAPGRSCPSDCASGRTGSDQRDLVLVLLDGVRVGGVYGSKLEALNAATAAAAFVIEDGRGVQISVPANPAQGNAPDQWPAKWDAAIGASARGGLAQPSVKPFWADREAFWKQRQPSICRDQTTGFDHVEHRQRPNLLFDSRARLAPNIPRRGKGPRGAQVAERSHLWGR